MWLFNSCGFYSVVIKPGDEAEGMVTVRSRLKADLEALRDKYMPELGEIITGAGTDYLFRARIARTAFAEGVKRSALDVHYGDFKSLVFASQGPHRARIYGKVWRDLIELEDDASVEPPSSLEPRMAWRLAKTVQAFHRMHGHWPTRIEMPKGYYNVLLLDIGQLWHQPMHEKLKFAVCEGAIRALDDAGKSSEYDRDAADTLDHREAFNWMFDA